MRQLMSWSMVGCLLLAGAASAQSVVLEQLATESPRTTMLEFKLGNYLPQIDKEKGLTGKPYESTFGGGAMLMLEVEGEWQFFQGFGSAAVGFSVGYAEKFGKATQVNPDGTTAPGSDSTGLRVVPLRLLGIYRFDVAANEWGIPLVPYVKAGLVGIPYWVTKGEDLERVNGQPASGMRFGYQVTGGLALQLDFLDRRFARDFDSGLGINHSYLFAEFTLANVDNFGSRGLVLSHRSWLFGLGLEY